MAQEIINGVPQNFGVPASVVKKPCETVDAGPVRTMVVEFKYDDLPGVSATDAGVLLIPAYSIIESARLHVEEAFAGGTSYDIGLQTSAGVAIDDDGLFAALALASINTKGVEATGAGALVSAAIGANPGQVKVTATGTFTAGKAQLYIRYTPAAFD